MVCCALVAPGLMLAMALGGGAVSGWMVWVVVSPLCHCTGLPAATVVTTVLVWAARVQLIVTGVPLSGVPRRQVRRRSLARGPSAGKKKREQGDSAHADLREDLQHAFDVADPSEIPGSVAASPGADRAVGRQVVLVAAHLDVDAPRLAALVAIVRFCCGRLGK